MAAASGPAGDTVTPGGGGAKLAAMNRKSQADMREVLIAAERMLQNKPFVDPLEFSELGERLQAKRLGLKRRADGTYVEPREKAAQKEMPVR